MSSTGKIIVVSAPSGCGKSTIIKQLLDTGRYHLHFSVSATNREPRPGEVDGVSYHFLTTDRFRSLVDQGEFVEWEEVYPGRYYGTLKSEIDRQLAQGHDVLLDIDVHGALNVKRIYGPRALTIFVEPPSIDALRQRLITRGTETPEVIDQRVARADYELSHAPNFDTVIVNDDLATAVADTAAAFDQFLNS